MRRGINRRDLAAIYARVVELNRTMHGLGSDIYSALPMELKSNIRNSAMRAVLAALGYQHAAKKYSRNNRNATTEAIALVCIRAFGGGEHIAEPESSLPRDARLNTLPQAVR